MKLIKFNIIFLLPVPSQPRFQKRIISFKELGANILVFSFERDYFEGNNNKCRYISLGKISHGKYIKRLKLLFRAFFKARKKIKKNHVIYAFGLDNAFLGICLKIFLKNKIKVVYECGDIRSLFLRQDFKGEIFRWLERFVMKRCFLIVTTSIVFINEYFIKIQRQDQKYLFLLENKIKEPMPKVLSKISWRNKKVIRIGFFGLLRCQRSWEILCYLAEKFPEKFIIYVRGIPFGINNFKEKVDENYNIIYEGEYINPDDLANIYRKVDIVWTAYNIENSLEGINRKWAMRNQFYESIYYNTPLIVQYGTEAANRIIREDIGIVINMNDKKKTIINMLKINHEKINKWRLRIQKLPHSYYIYSNEHGDLFNLLKS